MGISSDWIRPMPVVDVEIVVIESFKLTRPPMLLLLLLLLPLTICKWKHFDDKYSRNATEFDHKQDALIHWKCMQHYILMTDPCIYIR